MFTHLKKKKKQKKRGDVTILCDAQYVRDLSALFGHENKESNFTQIMDSHMLKHTLLDAKNGFWHIQLDEPSSFATTFGTAWGRYRWLRLLFGISPAPEEFQRRIDIALEGLPGQKAIADDILMFGAGDTDEQALKDHDRNLWEVLNRCWQRGIKLNSEKIQFRQMEVSYMGHIISSEGLQADPSKLKLSMKYRLLLTRKVSREY